jgi:hypothetical protein
VDTPKIKSLHPRPRERFWGEASAAAGPGAMQRLDPVPMTPPRESRFATDVDLLKIPYIHSVFTVPPWLATKTWGC